jgi:outer membrane protein OmpA-like peptidoglycan-associated protein
MRNFAKFAQRSVCPLLVSMIATTPAIAADELDDDSFGTRFSILGFADMGGMVVMSENLDEETDKSGYLVDGGGILSMYTTKASFDLGLGAFYSKVTGEAKVNPASTVVDRNEIAFTSGLISIAARYRLTPKFELGPILTATLGADGSFSPLLEEAIVPRVSGGVQFTRVWTDYESYDLRLNARAGIDFNVSARNLIHFAVGLAFGVPLTKPDTIVKTKTRTKIKTKTEVKVVEKPVYQAVMVFQTDAINFEYNSAVLMPESKAFLDDLGKLLSTRVNWWETLQIAGHTDQTGALDYNMKLSQDRADSVRNAILAAGGIGPERIEARGYGPTVPLVEATDAISLAKNRRVELMFGGEVDQMKLGPELDRVRRKHERPKTCIGQECR